MMRANRIWPAWLLFGLSLAMVVAWLWFGLSIGTSYLIGDLTSLTFLTFPVMGLFIVRRRPDHPISWLFMAIGVASGATLAGYMYVNVLSVKPGSLPAGDWIGLSAVTASAVLWIIFFVIILLFPDGRLPSRRWRPLAWAVMVVLVTSNLLATFWPGSKDVSTAVSAHLVIQNPLGISWIATLGPVRDLLQILIFPVGVICLLAPVLRFRGARGEERQQLKWFGLWAGVLGAWIGLYGLNQALGFAGSFRPVFDLAGGVGAAGVPVVMTIAILRYRLYDIDLIIRRTLVYSILTALLALTYWGGVVLLQAVLRPITGEGNDLAIVATTLLVAAIVLPLRRAVQNFIDRRFYRRKYDAARSLAAFASAAREEVELDKLTGRLVEVVDETVRPSHISLWLRASAGADIKVVMEEKP